MTQEELLLEIKRLHDEIDALKKRLADQDETYLKIIRQMAAQLNGE